MLGKLRRYAALALILGLTIVLTNCAGGDRARAPSSEPAVHRLPTHRRPGLWLGGQPVNLEPGNVTDGNSLIVQAQIYNRLIEFKPGTTDLQPDLATEWTASPDGKNLDVSAAIGVLFHDGSLFDAAAVKFNVDRWWDPKHPQGYRSAGKTYEIWQQIFGGFKGEPSSLLQEVKVVNPLTIQFRLKQPFSAFPSAIGSGFLALLAPSAIQQVGAKYGTPGSLAVGTGAFVLKEWRTGDQVILEKNTDYWQTSYPKTDQAVIRFVTDPAARLAQLRAGQIDFTVDLAPDQKPEIAGDANLTAIARPSFNVGYLALNPSYKPLADVRVRQAIAHAINRPAIVQSFWGELGQQDAHFTPPPFAWAQDSSLQPYPFDPDKAKQLLTAAGYPTGFDLDLWYMPVSRPYFPTPKPIAEAFAADLSAVGIRVNLKTKDWAAYIADRRKAPGYQAFMLGWTGDYGDPDSFYYAHFGPGATTDIGNWKDPKLLKLLDQGRAIADLAGRAQAYAEVDRILHREVLRLPIVHTQPLLAQRQTIQDWVPSPLGSEPFESIRKPQPETMP